MVCHKIALAFCFFASLVLCGNGFEFHWCETTSFNKRLECSVDANTSTLDIFTIIDLTIFDVTINTTSVKLAAISVLDTDLYIRHVSKSYLAVEGSISQHDAELVVPFNNQTYCSFCSYLCELNFINSAGHPVVRHITVKSSSTESGSSYNNVSVGIASQMMVAAVDRLTSIIHNVEDRVIKMAAVQEKTENRLTEMAAVQEKTENRLTEMAAIDEKTENRLTEMAAIDEQTENRLTEMAAITNKTENRLTEMAAIDEKTENRLTEMAAIIDKTENRLTEMAAVNNKTENRLTEMAAIDEKTENRLTQMAAINEKSTLALARLEEKLDNITALLTTVMEINKKMKNLLPETDLAQECKKGMAYVSDYIRNPRILVAVLDNKTALCDTDTDGGGWIIFQRRNNGGENFYRTWEEYKTGFGDVEGGGDYWLGLQSIHEITSKEKYELRIDMGHEGQTSYAKYSSFSIGSESTKFELMIGSYSGNTTDQMTKHKNMAFSTHDRDNDQRGTNCAQSYKGGWWYRDCYDSNLNGVWGARNERGINWGRQFTKLLTLTEMKIRRIS